jgi:hypothetical protein
MVLMAVLVMGWPLRAAAMEHRETPVNSAARMVNLAALL